MSFKIGQNILFYNKILAVRIKRAFIYIKNPYILNITYNKPYIKQYYLAYGMVAIPTTVHYNTSIFKMKFQDQESLMSLINTMKQHNVCIIEK